MEKIIEQVGPSRQLFEAVNFAFMKNLDLVKRDIYSGVHIRITMTQFMK